MNIRRLFEQAYDPNWRVQAWGGIRAAKSLDEMLFRLRILANEWLNDGWRDDETKKVCRYVLAKIETEKLREYARGVFDDGAKPIGLTHLNTHVQRAMNSKPPSEKQIGFLKKLGVTKVPESMAEASRMISTALGK